MELINLLSALSLTAVYAYLHIGFFTLLKNKHSVLNRVFFSLCFAFAIWSFAYSFAYLAENPQQFYFWNKLSAFGWCTYSALALYLVLLLTESKLTRNRPFIVLVFVPAAVFLFMALFLFGPDKETPEQISVFFYIGDFLYDFIYASISMILLALWGLRSESLRVKKQSRLLVISGVIPYTLNLLTQTVLPRFGFIEFPMIGQLYAVILVLGSYFVINKYKMLRIPGNIIVDEVENKIIELVILLNEKGEFEQLSKHVLRLLGFEEADLLGKNITVLFQGEDQSRFSVSALMHENEYEDIRIYKNGFKETIPVQIISVPIIDPVLKEFLGVLLVIRDISKEYELRAINAELHERTIRDSLSNLYNHQHSLELLNSEIEKIEASVIRQNLSIMMLDIDHFKKINDTYGHLYGDDIIKVVSSVMVQNVGVQGHVGRFGGEEFIIILPGTSLEEACSIGQKIRTDIFNYPYSQSLEVSISIGVVQYDSQSYVELLKRADDLLYQAKQNGRNRVECDQPY